MGSNSTVSKLLRSASKVSCLKFRRASACCCLLIRCCRKSDCVRRKLSNFWFKIAANISQPFSESRLKTNKYPDGNCIELKEAISKSFKLKSSNLFVGNGSDEILGIACQLFLNKGDEVIIPKHSFSDNNVRIWLKTKKLLYVKWHCLIPDK